MTGGCCRVSPPPPAAPTSSSPSAERSHRSRSPDTRHARDRCGRGLPSRRAGDQPGCRGEMRKSVRTWPVTGMPFGIEIKAGLRVRLPGRKLSSRSRISKKPPSKPRRAVARAGLSRHPRSQKAIPRRVGRCLGFRAVRQFDGDALLGRRTYRAMAWCRPDWSICPMSRRDPSSRSCSARVLTRAHRASGSRPALSNVLSIPVEGRWANSRATWRSTITLDQLVCVEAIAASAVLRCRACSPAASRDQASVSGRNTPVFRRHGGRTFVQVASTGVIAETGPGVQHVAVAARSATVGQRASV